MRKSLSAIRNGRDSTDIDDPLEVLDAMDVSKNVMRFVVYILWLKRQPNSFEEYLCLRGLHFDLWGDIYKNVGDYKEKEEVSRWWWESTHVSQDSRITQSWSWYNNLSNNRLTVPYCFNGCWRVAPCCFQTIFGYVPQDSLYAIVFALRCTGSSLIRWTNFRRSKSVLRSLPLHAGNKALKATFSA